MAQEALVALDSNQTTETPQARPGERSLPNPRRLRSRRPVLRPCTSCPKTAGAAFGKFMFDMLVTTAAPPRPPPSPHPTPPPHPPPPLLRI